MGRETVRAIQPDAGRPSSGTHRRGPAPDERIGDVLLAAAGVCLGTSGGLCRHDAGRPCCCFAYASSRESALLRLRGAVVGRFPLPHSGRSSRPQPLLRPWGCNSAGRAGSRVEAVVAHPAPARLNLGGSGSRARHRRDAKRGLVPMRTLAEAGPDAPAQFHPIRVSQ